MNVLLLLLLSGSVLLRDSILSRFDNDSKFAEKMSLCGNTLSLDLVFNSQSYDEYPLMMALTLLGENVVKTNIYLIQQTIRKHPQIVPSECIVAVVIVWFSTTS